MNNLADGENAVRVEPGLVWELAMAGLVFLAMQVLIFCLTAYRAASVPANPGNGISPHSKQPLASRPGDFNAPAREAMAASTGPMMTARHVKEASSHSSLESERVRSLIEAHFAVLSPSEPPDTCR